MHNGGGRGPTAATAKPSHNTTAPAEEEVGPITATYDTRERRQEVPLTVPLDAKVSKRPLFHPSIPSPYTGASQQKVVYVSARTPFLSAVKRVEKLLGLADRRLVQAATTVAKHKNKKRKRSADGEDGVLDVAEEVERLKAQKREGRSGDADHIDGGAPAEEVAIKGTGKAIARVMEMALWFQQRTDQYGVRLKTGTVTCIDDIDIAEQEDPQADEDFGGQEAEDGEGRTRHTPTTGTRDGDGRTKDGTEAGGQSDGGMAGNADRVKEEPIAETRLRYASALEAYVSLR